VQYYLLLAVSGEQRVLPAPLEVTPSNKSRGVRTGGALGWGHDLGLGLCYVSPRNWTVYFLYKIRTWRREGM